VTRIELPVDSKLDTEKREGLRVMRRLRLASELIPATSNGNSGMGVSGVNAEP
jgi:hypothetical protein